MNASPGSGFVVACSPARARRSTGVSRNFITSWWPSRCVIGNRAARSRTSAASAATCASVSGYFVVVADVLDADRDVIEPDAVAREPRLGLQPIDRAVAIDEEVRRDVDRAAARELLARGLDASGCRSSRASPSPSRRRCSAGRSRCGVDRRGRSRRDRCARGDTRASAARARRSTAIGASTIVERRAHRPAAHRAASIARRRGASATASDAPRRVRRGDATSSRRARGCEQPTRSTSATTHAAHASVVSGATSRTPAGRCFAAAAAAHPRRAAPARSRSRSPRVASVACRRAPPTSRCTSCSTASASAS